MCPLEGGGEAQGGEAPMEETSEGAGGEARGTDDEELEPSAPVVPAPAPNEPTEAEREGHAVAHTPCRAGPRKEP